MRVCGRKIPAVRRWVRSTAANAIRIVVKKPLAGGQSPAEIVRPKVLFTLNILYNYIILNI